MIIGNGLIAREFKKINIEDDNFVIIAAGVSNSQEIKEEEFIREKNLIEDILFKFNDKKIIYFSSCSILQNEITPYINHKIQMEKIIKNSNVDYYIFRLPQVVGVVNNNTLISYLIRNFYLHTPINIQKNTFRNLIDIEDVVKTVKEIIDNKSIPPNVMLNIASSSYITIEEIVKIIIKFIESNSKIKIISSGENYYIDNSQLKIYLGDNNIFLENYSSHVIEKYINKIKLEFSHEWDNIKK